MGRSALRTAAALGAAAAAVIALAPRARARPDEGLAYRLDALVSAAVPKAPGDLSLYVRDLTSGAEYARDSDRPVYLSSTIKIVVMLEVLRQVDAQELSLGQKIVFSAADVRDGVGPIKLGPPGRVFTVRQLLQLMMVESDNAAADLLMRWVGVDNLNEHPRLRGIEFGRLVTLLDEKRRIYAILDPRGWSLEPREIYELGKARTLDARARLFSGLIGRSPAFTGLDLARAFRLYYREGTNSASMRDVGELLSQLARCDGLSATSCALAHRLMHLCRTGSQRIRAGLPPSAPWAHKTGTQEGRACDVGFTTVRGHTVVVAACVREFGRVANAERLLREVGVAVDGAIAGAPIGPSPDLPDDAAAPRRTARTAR